MIHKLIITLAFALLSITITQASEKLLDGKQRILFLGDSITHGGGYVAAFDTWLVRRYPQKRITTFNAGLSSETVSGLSEEGHLRHGFARPCVFERLERVLSKTKPDLIIACYGMNCGIYLPLDEARFARYRNGILRLRAAARQYGAEIIHITPPMYDNHGKPGFNYDSVLKAYAEWLASQRENGWNVIDLHSEMHHQVGLKKQSDPSFTVQKDRVHPNTQGHWIMAQALIEYFGDPASAKLDSASALLGKEKLSTISKRMKCYQAAIHAETKPLRPNIKLQGTLESATATAQELNKAIY